MKPVTIKSLDQFLMFDKQKKHAEIRITQDCKIKTQILDYFLDMISNVETLKVDITEIYITDKIQYNHFLSLRDSIQVKITSDIKNLNTININYKVQNVGSAGIKNSVSFIQQIQNSAKVVEECIISISYSRSLINFEGIFQTIKKYYICIAGYITDFSLRFTHEISKENLLDLTELFLKLKNLKKFVFRAASSLNLTKDEQLAQFIQSMKNIIKSTQYFEFDLNEASFQRGVISSISENLSSLIAIGGEELHTVIIDLGKVGWTFDRQRLIKGNFVFGLAQEMTKWPKSIRHLTINLDRALSYNENISGSHVTFLLQGLKQIIPQLKSFDLNLNGIGFNMKEFDLSFTNELSSLLDNAKQLRSIELKLSGHLDLSIEQWAKFFQGITKVNHLDKLVLDIERWKNYPFHFTYEEQSELLNTFLDNLYNNHNSTLRQFQFDIDEWVYLQSCSSQYAEKLMKFKYVSDFQLLWFKSQGDDSLKNLDLIQTMSSYIQRDIYKFILIKKLGIDINYRGLEELQNLEDEELQKHVKKYMYLNSRLSRDSPQFINLKDNEDVMYE